MEFPPVLTWAVTLAPAALMALAATWPRPRDGRAEPPWRRFRLLSGAALACALAALALALAGLSGRPGTGPSPWLEPTALGAGLALLVQLLGTVIGAFSSRYLQGETGQPRYVAALAGVLAAVHVLLLAGHWLVLVAAWAGVGVALQRLLCFYPDRPFALLAAHKKRLADRLADVLLLVAATLAWSDVGSGSLADLRQHLAQSGASPLLQASAWCLALAVILRTALLPAHGWLIQVMEAPTPVSALLHAGVVNLGGYVLIRFAPLLEATATARWLLVGFGLGTALLAGLVMLTRVSIKVRLAWSTVAQMGFMVLECGLGLYTLAALHLIGHSLYKAHAFLSASTVVRETRLRGMQGSSAFSPWSFVLAPVLSASIVWPVQGLGVHATWPWWWSAILGLAGAPLLWLPAQRSGDAAASWWRATAGLGMVACLTLSARLVHELPLGLRDRPDPHAGPVALIGMAAMYLSLVTLQLRARALEGWRRWSYAGFYVDELTTRLALRLWPTRWTPERSRSPLATLAGPAALPALK
jgi:NAD(P)H-quinone oxidoreductase subunit 5